MATASKKSAPGDPLQRLGPDLRRIVEASHHDPFAALGRHPDGDGERVRCFIPGAAEVTLADTATPMERVLPEVDLFEARIGRGRLPAHHRLAWVDRHGRRHERHDPYTFPPQIGDLDLHLFGEGRHRHAYRFLGAHPRTVDGVEGTLFATWAPNAARVSVVGDFNEWDGRAHPMRVRAGGGVWELFIPGVGPGALYKLEVRNHETGHLHLKTDPYGRRFQHRPETASLVTAPSAYAWGDGEWLSARAGVRWQQAPLSIYEVHLGSWQRDAEGEPLDYRTLAERLVAYVAEQGFTHIEIGRAHV